MIKAIGASNSLSLAGTVAGVPPERPDCSPVRLVIEAIYRQRWLFFLIVFAVVGATAALILLKTRQFQSEMMFLVQASRSNSVISADKSTTAGQVQDVTEQQINSEMRLLQSEDVIGAVVDPQWSSIPLGKRTPEQIQDHESKIASFLKHLTLESSNKANVITATFRAENPEAAANALEQLSAAYLAKRRLIMRPPGTSKFFAEESKRYKEIWDSANKEMVDFQQANGLVSVPDMEEALSQQILQSENDLRIAQASYAETNQRVQEATSLLGKIPQRQATQQRLTPNQGSVEQLQGLLVQLQNRRAELLNRYQPTDRLVVEIDKQIENTSSALKKMSDGRQTEDTTDVSPAWQQVRTGQVQSIVEKRAIRSRIQSLTADIAKLRQQLAQVQPLYLKYNQLQMKVDQARNNFEVFSQKRDQSNIEDAMDEHKLVNIAIGETPTVNYTQVAPKPLLYSVLGVLSALFLAGSAVYFAESFRSTIATSRELGIVSRYPVVASIPLEPMGGRGEHSVRLPVIAGDQFVRGRAGELITVMQNMQDVQES
jgi:uncharacterized protein involved in exopolysaccharide biosynthesis